MKNSWPGAAAYRRCIECAEWGDPFPGLRFYVARYVGAEIDQWIDAPTCYPIYCLLRDREDFTFLELEGQRMFLILAAHVLFGKDCDAELRDECYRIAMEPL